MGDNINDSGTNSQQYYPVTKKEEDFLTPLLVLGSAIGLGYILNKHFLDNQLWARDEYTIKILRTII